MMAACIIGLFIMRLNLMYGRSAYEAGEYGCDVFSSVLHRIKENLFMRM